MFDLSLNSDFSVHLDDRNDLAVVDGRDQFEQSVLVHLTEFFHTNIIGELDPDTIATKLRIESNRVARAHDQISGIEYIEVEESPDVPNTYTLDIGYRTGEEFSTEISE